MSDLQWRLSSYTLAAALGLSALGAGGVHLPILSVCALLLLGVGLMMTRPRAASDGSRSRWNEWLGAGTLFALAAYSLLQAVPLPFSWLESIAPSNADVWSRAFRPLGMSPDGSASISLAPRRSVIEALKFACYGIVFFASARMSRHYGMHRLAALAFGLGVAVAVVTAGHQIVGAEELYGTYRPLNAYSIAPLLNANTRAGYLNLGFFCGVGLLFGGGARPLTPLIGLGLAFLAAEVLLCASVGGTGCLVLGLVAVLVIPRGGGQVARQVEGARLRQAGILVAIGIGATLMALAAQRSDFGLGDQSIEKLDLLSRSWAMALDHFWFGIGRGAFGSVFSAYQGPGPHVISEHAENFPVQWAAEWGIPAALTALLAMGCLLWPILGHRTLRSPTRRCALVGCAMLLLQNMVDLGLEIPAVAALLCCVLGALSGISGSSKKVELGRSGQVLAWMGCALTSLSLVLAIALGAESPGRLRHELHAELSAAPGAPSPAFWTRLRNAVRAYPAEPYFPLLGSSGALAAGEDAIPWISRALERSPTNAQSHLQLGRILHARRATDQAMGALRRAIELDPRQVRAVLRLGKQWGLEPAILKAAAPEGPAGAALLVLLAGVTRDIPTRLHLLEKALKRDPNQADAHHQLATELLRAVTLEQGTNVCKAQREPCLDKAAAHARRGYEPGSPRTGILEARILAERGQAHEAEEHLARTCEQLPGDLGCSDALVAQALVNDSPRLPTAVKSLIALACGNRERCGESHLKLGNRFAGAGQWHVALAHYRHATTETPSTQTWQALARAAERLGQETLAADARRRMALLKAEEASNLTLTLGEGDGDDATSSHPTPPSEDPLAPAASE